MKAFLSYQTSDKRVARELKEILERLGVRAFLAHDDIEVSEEWRLKLLSELNSSDLFVAVLSKNYFESIWCIQESGIAAARPGLTILPFSVDGTTPSGFFSHIQSSKIDPDELDLDDLIPGLVKFDKNFVIDAFINLIGRSQSSGNADYYFRRLIPYLDTATDTQKTDLLRASNANFQVCSAADCANKYLPPLLATHGKFLDQKERTELVKTLARFRTPALSNLISLRFNEAGRKPRSKPQLE